MQEVGGGIIWLTYWEIQSPMCCPLLWLWYPWEYQSMPYGSWMFSRNLTALLTLWCWMNVCLSFCVCLNLIDKPKLVSEFTFPKWYCFLNHDMVPLFVPSAIMKTTGSEFQLPNTQTGFPDEVFPHSEFWVSHPEEEILQILRISRNCWDSKRKRNRWLAGN